MFQNFISQFGCCDTQTTSDGPISSAKPQKIDRNRLKILRKGQNDEKVGVQVILEHQKIEIGVLSQEFHDFIWSGSQEKKDIERKIKKVKNMVKNVEKEIVTNKGPAFEIHNFETFK